MLGISTTDKLRSTSTSPKPTALDIRTHVGTASPAYNPDLSFETGCRGRCNPDGSIAPKRTDRVSHFPLSSTRFCPHTSLLSYSLPSQHLTSHDRPNRFDHVLRVFHHPPSYRVLWGELPRKAPIFDKGKNDGRQTSQCPPPPHNWSPKEGPPLPRRSARGVLSTWRHTCKQTNCLSFNISTSPGLQSISVHVFRLSIINSCLCRDPIPSQREGCLPLSASPRLKFTLIYCLPSSVFRVPPFLASLCSQAQFCHGSASLSLRYGRDQSP